MTKSELICNAIADKFFGYDFVYENLKYHNSSGNKCELCDALFEYADTYLILQIKERSISNGKSEQDWLDEVVYGKAAEQIKSTIHAINAFDISVNNKHHQNIKLCKNKKMMPLIVFDNKFIHDYKRVIELDDGTVINVISINDYKEMLDAIILPYDVICYLNEREKWFKDNKNFPNVIIGENVNSITLSQIKSEKDFSTFYKDYFHDGDSKKYQDSLRILSIINNFKSRMTNKADYRKILSILQLIKPDNASCFMERFNYAWEKACDDKFDYSKGVQLIYNGKKTSVIFFAVGREDFPDSKFYKILCDAKQLQQRSDNVLLISFIGDGKNCCQINWIYYEREYIDDLKALKFYEDIGTFNGAMDRQMYEMLCKKMFDM